MTAETLLHFKEILTRRLERIQPGFSELISTLRDSKDYEEPMDVMDLTATRCARDLMIEIHRHDRLAAVEIRGALRRIAAGSFGICEECGDEIGVERLKAQPITRVCIECRKRMEAFGRLDVA